MAVKVTLRSKKIKNKRSSLYLDYYPAITNPKTGKETRREFLGMYLFDNPIDQSEEKQNENNLSIAKSIREKKQNELNKPEIYSTFEKQQLLKEEKANSLFFDYCDQYIKDCRVNVRAYKLVLQYLKSFADNKTKFKAIDKTFCENFKSHLINTSIKKKQLSKSTASVYYSSFRSILKSAYINNYLEEDFGRKLSGIKVDAKLPDFLTLEEVNSLIQTDCPSPELKRAALFSALTGLRVSDIIRLDWANIIKGDSGDYNIRYTQKKTQSNEFLPIGEQAYSLLGETKTKGIIFDKFKNTSATNLKIEIWTLKAGITKKVTFHTFRHTFATLQLSEGKTDIYTVSKLLGHKNLNTTQKYAQVVDQAKRDAVNKIKLNL